MNQAKVVDALASLAAIGGILISHAMPNTTVNGTERVIVSAEWLAALGNSLFVTTSELTKQIFGNEQEG